MEFEDGPGSNAGVGEAIRWDLPVRVGARIVAVNSQGCLAFLERVSRGTYPSFEATFAALVDLALRLTLSPDLMAARFRPLAPPHPACLLALPLLLLPRAGAHARLDAWTFGLLDSWTVSV